MWIVIEAYHEDQQQEWERARLVAYNIHLHAPYMKRKAKDIQSFLPFSWDKKHISRTQQRIQEYINSKKDAC